MRVSHLNVLQEVLGVLLSSKLNVNHTEELLVLARSDHAERGKVLLLGQVLHDLFRKPRLKLILSHSFGQTLNVHGVLALVLLDLVKVGHRSRSLNGLTVVRHNELFQLSESFHHAFFRTELSHSGERKDGLKFNPAIIGFVNLPQKLVGLQVRVGEVELDLLSHLVIKIFALVHGIRHT